MSKEVTREPDPPSRRGKKAFRNRNRLEIVSTMLTKARNGALKTHLMYGANLSYPLLEEYLAKLLESRLLAVETDGESKFVRYKTTLKGFEFLEDYKKIVALLGESSILMTGSLNLEEGSVLAFESRNNSTQPMI